MLQIPINKTGGIKKKRKDRNLLFSHLLPDKGYMWNAFPTPGAERTSLVSGSEYKFYYHTLRTEDTRNNSQTMPYDIATFVSIDVINGVLYYVLQGFAQYTVLYSQVKKIVFVR